MKFFLPPGLREFDLHVHTNVSLNFSPSGRIVYYYYYYYYYEGFLGGSVVRNLLAM